MERSTLCYGFAVISMFSFWFSGGCCSLSLSSSSCCRSNPIFSMEFVLMWTSVRMHDSRPNPARLQQAICRFSLGLNQSVVSQWKVTSVCSVRMQHTSNPVVLIMYPSHVQILTQVAVWLVLSLVSTPSVVVKILALARVKSILLLQKFAVNLITK